MLILITGGCKNGKSSLAQTLACLLAEQTRTQPYYFATMIPHDEEDELRITKHRAERAQLNFETIECGKDIAKAAQRLEQNRVVLFDSITAVLANEMFSAETINENAEETVIRALDVLCARVSSVIFVSDAIFSDGHGYGDTTETYRSALAHIEQHIASKADGVYELIAGTPVAHKGTVFWKRAEEESVKKTTTLIIGGAYQGKTVWAQSQFGLLESDIAECTSDEAPDTTKRCLTHFENYVAFCLKNGKAPRTDFYDTIIICDDIFCGVVPLEQFQRKLREATGIALQKIARHARVIRIVCGQAEELS